jgi:intein/homing endonuclease
MAIIDIFIGTDKISCTTDHPFWVPDKGWVLAYQLSAGTVLQTHAGQSLTIDDVRRRDEVTPVYNVEIDGLHTYFVSDLEILSHNMCSEVDDLVTNNAARPADSPFYEVGFEAQLERGKDVP